MTAIFRPMVDADRQFVISGWSSSLRTSKWSGLISMSRWAYTMHLEIEAILRRPGTAVIVAEEPGEQIETDSGPRPWLYGFIATREDLSTPVPYVYYCYVKGPFRRARARLNLEQGYATQLFAAAGIDPTKPFLYASRTSSSEALLDRIPRAEWDPLPARYEEPNEREQEARRGAQGRHSDPPRPLPHRR